MEVGLPGRKTVRTASGTDVETVLARAPFLACCACGAPVDAGNYYAVCSDCGGVFCENCVRDGTYENHDCEED